MTDLDNDLNRQLLNGKSGQMTSSRNSFHSAANEILSNDQKIREGRLPSMNQTSKRRTIRNTKTNIKRQRTKKKKTRRTSKKRKIR